MQLDAARLDIVCVQETWVGHSSNLLSACSTAEVEHWLYDAARTRGVAPYTAFGASNTTTSVGRNGVAILVRVSEGLHVSNLGITTPCGRLPGVLVR